MTCGTKNTERLAVEELKPPAFQPGDTVKGTSGWMARGRVIRIKYIYEVEDNDSPGDTEEYEEDEINALTLTDAEVWTDAVLLVHAIIESGEFEFPYSYSQQFEADKQIRHRFYQFIGGLGVKVTEEMRGRGGSVQRVIDRIRSQKQ